MSDAITMPMRFGSNSGQSVTRRDGIAKVTGRATYAADNHPDGMLYAVYAPATIARGRVTHLDTEAAKAHPGVVEVFTPKNRPPVVGDPDKKPFMFAIPLELLQNDTVRYAMQPIALVIGETLEAATEGARLLNPQYEAETPRTGMDAEPPKPAAAGPFGRPAQVVHGDIDAGLADAVQILDVTYDTPAQYHNAMEPHAIVAKWDGDKLEIDTPNQAIVLSRGFYAYYFGIPPENILIRSPYLGGGFGSKAVPYSPLLLAVAAARQLGRPLKLVLSRSQMFAHRYRRRGTNDGARSRLDGHCRHVRQQLPRAGRWGLAGALCGWGPALDHDGGAKRYWCPGRNARSGRGFGVGGAGMRHR
jgi:xanthine dehydrogenase YagR molybdenum-binding subunit